MNKETLQERHIDVVIPSIVSISLLVLFVILALCWQNEANNRRTKLRADLTHLLLIADEAVGDKEMFITIPGGGGEFLNARTEIERIRGKIAKEEGR